MLKGTSLVVKQDRVELTRFIDAKLWRVEFNKDVLAKDLEEYFHLSDNMFKLVARPCEVNLEEA